MNLKLFTGSWIITMVLVIGFMQCKPVNTTSQNELESIYLDSLESLFADVPQWLETVYDSTSGGFFHNALMAKDSLYTTDMQSAAFALNILLNGNIVDSLPASIEKGLQRYALSCYDSASGLFLDAQYAERIQKSDRALGRSQVMASLVIDRIGLADIIIVKRDKNNTPPYLHSLEQFQEWFYNRKWTRVWTAFDHLISQVAFINQLPEERADSIIQFVAEYVVSIQDEDGLWGKGQAQEVRISGAVKLGGFCQKMGIPMPNPDRMYRTIMGWMRVNTELDFSKHSVCPICVPRNVFKVLEYLQPQLSFEIPQTDRELMVKNAYQMLKFYHHSDGGFIKNHKECRIAPLDLNHGSYDTLVSDTNGTHLAISTRTALYTILRKDIPMIPSDFLKKLNL